MRQKNFTAQEIAEMLKEEGYLEISRRTIYYYVFEKNMFTVSGTGKAVFTDEDIDKIRAIYMLKKCTDYSLEQIKEIINTQSLNVIWQSCHSRTLSATSQYISSLKTNLDSGQITANNYNTLQPTGSSNQESFSTVNKKTIKVSEDVTLVLGENIKTKKFQQIIEFIKNLKE